MNQKRITAKDVIAAGPCICGDEVRRVAGDGFTIPELFKTRKICQEDKWWVFTCVVLSNSERCRLARDLRCLAEPMALWVHGVRLVEDWDWTYRRLFRLARRILKGRES